MSKAAFGKIEAGLKDALAMARRETLVKRVARAIAHSRGHPDAQPIPLGYRADARAAIAAYHAGCEIAEKISERCACCAAPSATEVLAEAMWIGETGAKWEFAQTNYAGAYREKAADTLFALSAAGYAIVPREPTEAMINAAPDLGAVDFYPSDVWRAMIAAALGEETP